MTHATDPVNPVLENKLCNLLIARVRDYAIFMLNPDGQVMTWNDGARLIKGYTRDEIVGQSITRFYTPEDAVVRDRGVGEIAQRARRATRDSDPDVHRVRDRPRPVRARVSQLRRWAWRDARRGRRVSGTDTVLVQIGITGARPFGLRDALSAGAGFAGVQERLRQLGGTVKVVSGGDHSTIEATLPVSQK